MESNTYRSKHKITMITNDPVTWYVLVLSRFTIHLRHISLKITLRFNLDDKKSEN